MRRWRVRERRAGAVLMAGAAVFASSARAQAPAASPTPVAQASEVVVTADRRAGALEKTPTAISSVSASTLDRGFVTDLAGLNGLVPSLEITHQSGFENALTIRGVGYATPENSTVAVPGVAEFVDGVYIANTISLDQTLFDVDHIEVLRGPQGALYGQSAAGGAVSILTRQPQLKAYDASGDASFGTYALHRERLEANLPLGDTLAVRVSAQAFDHDGFTKNLALPGVRLDDAHDISGKVSVLWRPNAAFQAILTGQVSHADQNGAAQKNIVEDTLPGLQDPRVVYQDYPATFDLTTQLYHLNLEYRLPAFTVKSVTAYQQLDHVQQEDGSRSAYSILHLYDDVAGWNTHLENYTEELDLVSPSGGRLEWTVGAFALAQRTRQFVAEFDGFGTPPPADLSIPADIETNPPANTVFGQLIDVNRQSYSLFGQATWRVTGRLRLIGGVRVNRDSYTPATYSFPGAIGNGPYNPSPQHLDCPASFSRCGYSDTVPTFKAEADYDLTPVSLLYASVARGYKPGGANANPTAVVTPHQFAYETNTALEIGSKSRWFDRRLRLDLAAFYDDYRDMQYLEVDPVPFQYGTANIPSIHIYGLEAEGGYASRDGRLQIDGSLALENGFAQGDYRTLDSTVVSATEASAAACGNSGAYYNPACWAAVEAAAEPIRGRTPPDLPKLSGSASIAYRLDLPGAELTPRVQYVYRGGEWARIFNDPMLDHVGAYGVVNLDLVYHPLGSPWRASLAATNVLDRDGVNSRYTDPYGVGATSQQFIPPRQIIGTIAFAY